MNFSEYSLRKIAKYGSPFFGLLERPFISHWAGRPEAAQPVFIIGAPRTGSTILYQLLTNEYDLLYPDNLVEIFRRNFYLGFWLSQMLYAGRPHNSFQSQFGNTSGSGLRAPSECGSFWYRWLPRDRHYIGPGDFNDRAVRDIHGNIFAVINRYARPLLFKNLNAGQRMALLAEVAPGARFIWVRRDPLFTAQSIYRARLKVYGTADRWWSVMPARFGELIRLPWPEQIIGQIYYIEKQIYLDRKLFPADAVFEMDYEQLCARPREVLDDLARGLGEPVVKRSAGHLPELKCNNTLQLTGREVKLLKDEIKKYDWTEFTTE